MMTKRRKVQLVTTLEQDTYDLLKKKSEEESRHMNYYIEKGLKIVLSGKDDKK
jgi:hypothetical protein